MLVALALNLVEAAVGKGPFLLLQNILCLNNVVWYFLSSLFVWTFAGACLDLIVNSKLRSNFICVCVIDGLVLVKEAVLQFTLFYHPIILFS